MVFNCVPLNDLTTMSTKKGRIIKSKYYKKTKVKNTPSKKNLL